MFVFVVIFKIEVIKDQSLSAQYAVRYNCSYARSLTQPTNISKSNYPL